MRVNHLNRFELNAYGSPLLQSGRRPECAFTVDVEDWYQSSVDFAAPITERVVRNIDRLVEVLDEAKVKATFFVQGMVAEKFPRMLEQLLALGHEIQSHGHTHRPLFAMNRQQLQAELEQARKSVEDACGVQVTAFRAPDFSIMEENVWALEVLAESGFTIDSSIFPMKMKRYGIRDWSNRPEELLLGNGMKIVEAPVAVWKTRSGHLPVAGGGYFRLLPKFVLRHAIRRMLSTGTTVIIYCHPYEFNSTELNDYIGRAPRRFLFTQGLGRDSFVQRVRSLFAEFSFGRFDETLATTTIA